MIDICQRSEDEIQEYLMWPGLLTEGDSLVA